MEETKKEMEEVSKDVQDKTDNTLKIGNNLTIDNNLTISTKLSTEQLICKTPQESPSASLKSSNNISSSNAIIVDKAKIQKPPTSSIIYLANLQILFGISMIVFGSFVIYYNASLHQVSSIFINKGFIFEIFKL